MSQWTPGPWEVARRAYVTIEAPAHCGPIACMANRLDLPVSDSRVQATQEANACLIALAPEMMEALQRIRDHETRADRRHRGMVDVEEVETLRRIARALLARLDA